MSTKRLSDVQVLSGYDSNHPEGRAYGLTLKADHLQAREDVKRLRMELMNARNALGSCATAAESAMRRIADLLSEVEAVRQ